MDFDEELERRLSNPWISSLIFGAVFVAAVLINLVRLLIALLMTGGGAGFRAEAGGFLRLVGVALVFALGAGFSSAFCRRVIFRRSAFTTRNSASGTCAGLAYTAACVWFFGGGMGWAILPLAVFAGINWAVTSGLNSI